MMKIDLHVHSRERSHCGRSSEEEQIRAAIKSGLNAIVFTDHSRLVSPGRVKELNDKYTPFRIFGGIEISLESDDILILGLYDHALESTEWTYPKLHTFVRERGGFIAIAHPFRHHKYIGVDIERFPPDAIEAHSHNTPKEAEAHIREIAANLGVPILCNSDAHHTSRIGAYYNTLERVPANERELLEILKSGQFKCSYPK